MNLKTLLIMAGVTFSPAILLGQNASAQSDTLKTVNRLKEVVVRGYGAERNLKAPEMGRVSLSSNMIANLPVMFGEPDIVKALQTLPGVSQGMEGFTGLYVKWRASLGYMSEVATTTKTYSSIKGYRSTT